MPGVLVATRKGLFMLAADGARRSWALSGPHFLGQAVNHAVLDPRDGRTLLAAVKAGHLGPTVFRSEDRGATWQEAQVPPAFSKAGPGEEGESVSHVFWLTPGAASEPGRWYAGTSPQGLFVSEDGGRTWAGVDGFNRHPDRRKWIGGAQDAPPGGGTLHSINLDPRDRRHIYIGMSTGGVFESRDAGASWSPLNRGVAADFLPDPEAEHGHDPHCLRVHPRTGDVYQQNHCGIYRLDREAARWQRIGSAMPAQIGDIGFPLVLHPRDARKLWVFPMDGGTVWPRVPIGGRPAAYRSRDAGASWERLDRGLPGSQGWFTVKRQAMAADDGEPVGVYFGTTGGEVWASLDEGESWQCLALHLPEVLAVETAA
ncbi:MAG TPA: exo-alpha-sialidase [Acetobacteraceae bacterium]|nr:exo-alpha-sialidase [Acetobacteraceae bacterium]